MNKTKYFLDTEFNEYTPTNYWGKKGKPTIDLISIALVCEDGREFYAISKDFDIKAAWNKWEQRKGQGDYNVTNPKHYWLRENVLFPVFKDLLKMHQEYSFKANQLGMHVNIDSLSKFNLKNFTYLINVHGLPNTTIANHICDFIYQFGENNIDSHVSPLSAARYYGPADESKNPEFYAYYADYDWVVFCWLFGSMVELPFCFPQYCLDLKQIMLENERNYGDHVYDYAEKLKKLMDSHNNNHNALEDARFNSLLYKFLRSN